MYLNSKKTSYRFPEAINIRYFSRNSRFPSSTIQILFLASHQIIKFSIIRTIGASKMEYQSIVYNFNIY